MSHRGCYKKKYPPPPPLLSPYKKVVEESEGAWEDIKDFLKARAAIEVVIE